MPSHMFVHRATTNSSAKSFSFGRKIEKEGLPRAGTSALATSARACSERQPWVWRSSCHRCGWSCFCRRRTCASEVCHGSKACSMGSGRPLWGSSRAQLLSGPSQLGKTSCGGHYFLLLAVWTAWTSQEIVWLFLLGGVVNLLAKAFPHRLPPQSSRRRFASTLCVKNRDRVE